MFPGWQCLMPSLRSGKIRIHLKIHQQSLSEEKLRREDSQSKTKNQEEGCSDGVNKKEKVPTSVAARLRLPRHTRG
eukprot:TRINITY_DN979_c0_g1_i1.p2 TRINITY_DN979_c0_g1~~TRINITY_DN979_c0_g1_i1.p2  ORF type:complete len:76 (+),score=23.25 TRINITY_DN979_c0_g1_i1:554-781(+)